MLLKQTNKKRKKIDQMQKYKEQKRYFVWGNP